MTATKEKEYAVKICVCGNRDIKLIDGPWTDPRVHCNKCGAWAIGNTREDVVKRWNGLSRNEIL
ncbi:hypothetical protein LCGC14_1743830 [marine sediment metagenome]|uniref:Uncharacterized protein n=1 Tax=marine sediment metagenome TaxID=412755 RepID=A0A0F9JL68_9ZZZZ